MDIDPKKLDAYHERIGVKASRHPFTAGGGKNGKATSGCVICPFSEGHATHQGAEVVSLAQFRVQRWESKPGVDDPSEPRASSVLPFPSYEP